MPIKETPINTGALIDGITYNFPISYTDELLTTSPYELVKSSFHKSEDVDPYLFVGYFTDNNHFSAWYFSNSRSHTSMVEAIQKDLGRSLNSCWGQLHLRIRPKSESGFLLTQLQIFKQLSPSPDEEKKIIKLLISKINPKNFSDWMEIFRYDKWRRDYEMHYIYYKDTQILENQLKKHS